MAKLLTTLRNNWKKTVFFTLAGGYGANYGYRKHVEFQMMRDFCFEALKYGEQPHPYYARLYSVTVILNPAASGGWCFSSAFI